MDSVQRVASIEEAVARIGAHAGMTWRVAAPLGLGKPNRLLNAMVAAAQAQPALNLHLYTALSLARPAAASDLERRFVAPFSARHFGADYPDLAYVELRRQGQLPPNVRVSEFYLQSGSLLDCAPAQRDYASLNYTHVARDLADVGINVVVQLVARRAGTGRVRYSLASNPDVTQDLLDAMASAGQIPKARHSKRKMTTRSTSSSSTPERIELRSASATASTFLGPITTQPASH